MVHKHVKNSKSLGINSNNTIFLWKGEDGLNFTKNSIEKYIMTPFREIKLQTGSNRDIKEAKKQSVFVNQPTGLLRRSATNYSKVDALGIGLGSQKEVCGLFR